MKSLESLVVRWNGDWPWDYMWRKKYNVAFNSEKHREMNPLDMRLDLLEETMIKEQIEREDKIKEDLKSYEKTGEWWKTSEEIGSEEGMEMQDELFDNIKI